MCERAGGRKGCRQRNAAEQQQQQSLEDAIIVINVGQLTFLLLLQSALDCTRCKKANLAAHNHDNYYGHSLKREKKKKKGKKIGVRGKKNNFFPSFFICPCFFFRCSLIFLQPDPLQIIMASCACYDQFDCVELNVACCCCCLSRHSNDKKQERKKSNERLRKKRRKFSSCFQSPIVFRLKNTNETTTTTTKNEKRAHTDADTFQAATLKKMHTHTHTPID